MDAERAVAGGGDQHLVARIGAEFAGSENVGDYHPAALREGGGQRASKRTATAIGDEQLDASGAWRRVFGQRQGPGIVEVQ